MEPKEHDPTATKRRVWLLCLLAAHVVLGVALGAFVRLGGYHTIPAVPVRFFVGLVFAQTSLLGIWTGFGRSPWWLRLSGFAVGAGCLGVGGCIGINEPDWLSFCLFAGNGVIATVVLTIFRCARFRVTLPVVEYHTGGGRQIGIRHLLILTAVVAAILGVGRHLKFGGFDVYPLPALISVYLVLLVFSCVLVGTLSAWAMLRERALVLRGAILLVVAATAGWGVAQIVSGMLVFWLVVYLTQAIILIVSLLVVRSCGYRLMRLPRGASKTGAGGETTALSEDNRRQEDK